MSKLFAGFLFMCIGLMANAADVQSIKKYNLLTFRQIEVESPWLQTGNSAGLSQISQLFPGEIKFSFGQSDGNFHSVFNGKTVQSFDFSSQSFRKINKTFLFGSFGYSRSFEKGLNFSNTNNPAINYPYLLADTIGNDIYDREFFGLAATIASPVNSKLDWGLNVDYQVGIAAQNRDPRPENKVMRGNISPGLLFKQDRFKLGMNLTYGYYNEDIDVSVVEEGVEYTLFQLRGPGAFTYHVSDSFYRLYQQHQLGGGLQLEIKNGSFSNIFHSDYLYSMQFIDDGRRGSKATWGAVKNDARMDGVTWNLSNVLSVDRGKKLHQLMANFYVASRLGTEFIQRLEKIGETDLERWKTYGKEQKYYSFQTYAKLTYLLMQKDDNNQLKSLFRAGMGYWASEEKYYLPNNEIRYNNLTFESSFLKLFACSKSDISAELKFRYQFYADGSQNLNATNFLAKKIYLPEFDYRIKKNISPGISVSYQVPVKKMFSKYFIKSDFDWYHSEKRLNRTIFSLSTGLIF